MLLCAPITEMTQYLLWCQVSHPLDRKRRETRNQRRRGSLIQVCESVAVGRKEDNIVQPCNRKEIHLLHFHNGCSKIQVSRRVASKFYSQRVPHFSQFLYLVVLFETFSPASSWRRHRSHNSLPTPKRWDLRGIGVCRQRVPRCWRGV